MYNFDVFIWVNEVFTKPQLKLTSYHQQGETDSFKFIAKFDVCMYLSFVKCNYKCFNIVKNPFNSAFLLPMVFINEIE